VRPGKVQKLVRGGSPSMKKSKKNFHKKNLKKIGRKMGVWSAFKTTGGGVKEENRAAGKGHKLLHSEGET